MLLTHTHTTFPRQQRQEEHWRKAPLKLVRLIACLIVQMQRCLDRRGLGVVARASGSALMTGVTVPTSDVLEGMYCLLFVCKTSVR